MKLTKKSETSTKITFTYDKPADAVEGYLYYAGGVRVSRTFNPNDLEVTFGKVPSGQYAVEAVGFDVIDRAEWPDAPPPQDTTPPTVSLSSPVNGATVKGTVTVAAMAGDDVGVTKVEFFRDNVLIGSDAAAPYSVGFDTTSVSDGTYALGARAYDAAGNVGLATEVTVTVDNIADPPPPGTAPWKGSFNASYQAAPLGSVITVPPGTYPGETIQWRPDVARKGGSGYIKFVMGGPVTINGKLEVRGSATWIDGGGKLNVKGYLDTEADSNTNHPDNNVFENIKCVSIGAFNSETTTFRKCDVGPATTYWNGSQQVVAREGPGMENKIGFGGGTTFVPKDILFEGCYIHNQNGDATRLQPGADVHFGGLFLVTVDGLTIKDCIFERNVVYHIQIQNFDGPRAKRVVIEHNSFGAPVEWLYDGDVPDGQACVQFDYDPGTEFTLKDNVSAGGLYGCYVGNCGGLVGVKNINNKEVAVSTTAPPLS